MFEESIEDQHIIQDKFCPTTSKKVTFNTENVDLDYDEVFSQNFDEIPEDNETAALKRILQKSTERLNIDLPTLKGKYIDMSTSFFIKSL